MVRKGFGTSAQPPENRPSGTFDGYDDAIRRYNGRTDLTASNKKYSVEYRERIFERADNYDTKTPIYIKK